MKKDMSSIKGNVVSDPNDFNVGGIFSKQDFLRWVDENDYFYKHFDYLATRLEDFITQYEICTCEYANDVAQQMDQVLGKCDEITYEERGAAIAYAILHFLDRYHRFQLMYSTLIERRLLPFPINVNSLDIGTGPAPALYALVDIYRLIKQYSKENNIRYLEDIQLFNDYAEQSQGFRQFLHHFTEILNMGNNLRQYSVPYHFGNFHDFNEVDYNRRVMVQDYDNDGDEIWLNKIEKFRHNIVILSNFLTTKDTVTHFADSLYNTALNMRNRGIILVAGARSTSPKYREIYPELDKILAHRSYTNSRFEGRCKKVCSVTLGYSYNDRFGARIKTFLQSILDHFSSMGAMSNIPKTIIAATKPSYSYAPQWEMHVFKRYSKFIGRRYKHKKKE